ncbi:MAG: InlB B-repeat-containing protein, partial [Clostridia bacterium]|nr:InlB B-repeat-containing protein [Clostridia bacterium]
GGGGGGAGSGGLWWKEQGNPGTGGKEGGGNGARGTDGTSSKYSGGTGGNSGSYSDESTVYVRQHNASSAPDYAKGTVTFHKEGGTDGIGSIICTIGYPMTESGFVAPTKAGYAFDGYYTAASGGTKYYNADGTSAHVYDYYELDLYAHWTPVHQVTVTATNASYTTTSTPDTGYTDRYTIRNNENFTFTVTPDSANGYGTYTVKVNGSTLNPTTTGGHTYTIPNITAPKSVVISGVLNTYTVTFNYGDNQTSTVTKTHGTTLTTAEIPTDTDKSPTASTVYTFTGWDPSTSAPITADTTFNAQYNETTRKYHVTVTPGTGTTISGATTGDYDYGTVLTVTAAATEGYDQSTPVLLVTGETVTGTSHTFTVTGNTTVSTADLDLNTYTVTFNYGDGLTSTVTKTHGTTLTTAEIPTNTDKSPTASTVYAFTGWDGNTAAPITADTTFTAQYDTSTRKYHVTVTPGTGTSISGVTTGDYDYGTPITVTAAAQSGYTQSTPEISINGTAVTGTSHTFTVTGNTTVSTADLELNTYTVTFNYGDGLTSTVTKTHGTTLTTAEIPTNTGKATTASTIYTFTGWDNDTSAPIIADTTFTAQYSETTRKYHVTVTPGTGTTISGVTTGDYDYGTEITVTAAAQSGYTQSTPVISINDEPVTGTSYTFTVTGNTTVSTADLELNTYTVTFKYGDNQTSTVTKTHGTTLTTAEIPTDTDKSPTSSTVYAFTGWDGNTAAPITADTTFTAQYDTSTRKYHVTVTPGTGTTITGVTTGDYDYGTSITVIAAASEGYTQSTPVISINGTAVTGTTYTFTVTGDTTVTTAALPINVYTLTVNEGTGTEITFTADQAPDADGKYPHGTVITATASAKTGYDQSTPVLSINDESVAVTTYTFTLSENTTVSTADLALNRYTLTVNEGTGTEITYTADHEPGADGKYPHGTVITASASALTGYTDSTPALTITGGTLVESGVVTMTGDVTLSTADLTLNTYTVTFIDGETTTEIPVAYGSTVTPPAFQKTQDEYGHVYTRVWQGEGDLTAPVTADMTFTAVYTFEHTFGNVVDAVASTCTVPGNVAYKVCSVCEKAFTPDGEPLDETALPLDPDNHVHTRTDPAVTATCVSDGYTEGVFCLDENRYVSGHVNLGTDPDNHDFGEWATVTEPTCAEPGLERCECTRCDAFKEREIPTLDHTPGEPTITDVVGATCSEPGSYHIKTFCTKCGALLNDEVVTTGTLDHVAGPSEISERVEPTCTEEGSYRVVIKCVNCGTTLTDEIRSIPKIAHTPGEVFKRDEVAPTCTEEGSYMEVTLCAVCGNEMRHRTIMVRALGHEYGEWTNTVEPTCTEPGERTSTCVRCGEPITDVAPKLGHNWGPWEVVIAPDYGVEGLEKRCCTRCDAEQTQRLTIGSNRDRGIQFIGSKYVKFTVYAGETTYIYNTDDANVLEWYSGASLKFDVEVNGAWASDGFVVLVNQQPLEPNADGSYTIPAGRNYLIVNVMPVTSVEPAEPDPGTTPSSGSGRCPYCGQVHGSSIWNRIVAFIHLLLYYILHIFGRM